MSKKAKFDADQINFLMLKVCTQKQALDRQLLYTFLHELFQLIRNKQHILRFLYPYWILAKKSLLMLAFFANIEAKHARNGCQKTW